MAIANSDGSIILSTKIVFDGLDKAAQTIKNKFAKISREKNAFSFFTEESKRLQGQLKELEKEYAILLSKENELGDNESFTYKLEAIERKIAGTKRQLKETTEQLGALGKKSTKSFADISKGLKDFGKRIAGIIKSALIFSLLYKVMQSVVKLFQNILMSDEEFKQDWEELKAAFYAAAYPIVNLIVPAIKWIVQQVRDWAVSIGKVAAALQGMSYSELVDQAKASKEAADNYSDMEKSSKKTADNVKKQLAGFDDIQILSSGNEEEQGANGAGFEGLGQYDTSGERSMLDDLMKAIGGALIAVGLILLFHGQLAWGIGFIIAGAIAGLFEVAIATLSDESVSQKAKDELSNAMLIVGVVAIVLGILLCMAQQWVWGIGLIAVGVASIVTPIALNWDGIKEQLQGSFGGWLVLGGVIAIILGILLCFTPMLPLGIGLIVLGVGAVVAPIVANWDAITERLHNFFTENAGLITGASIGLIILGILLCFTPMIGLGIGLIVAGAAGLAGVIAVNWNAIVDWVKGAWEAVKSFWKKYIAPVFTAKFWLDLGKTCINGLISGFEAGVNGIIWLFESMINFIVDALNKLSFDVPDWVPLIGGEKFGFNIPRANFRRLSIPRLAQGAVIPPNREFLAVLGDQKQGTNIEAPLQTIVDAFNMALAQNGNTGGGNTEVILEIDGREFGRAVVEQGNKENRRIGTRLVIV